MRQHNRVVTMQACGLSRHQTIVRFAVARTQSLHRVVNYEGGERSVRIRA